MIRKYTLRRHIDTCEGKIDLSLIFSFKTRSSLSIKLAECLLFLKVVSLVDSTIVSFTITLLVPVVVTHTHGGNQ